MSQKYYLINYQVTSKTHALGSKLELHDCFSEYCHSILKSFKNIKAKESILLDCSNGAYYQIEESLREFGVLLSYANFSPNGENINLGCGALEQVNLLKTIKETKHKYGIAFDGDGDRAVFVSNDYGIIETEKIILLFFKILNEESNNKKNCYH